VSLDSLYQEIILDHYRSPRNRQPLDRVPHLAEHENPACGDTIKLTVEIDGEGKVGAIAFDGKGCAISVASASMMTELVKGLPVAEARRHIDRFLAVMRGAEDAAALDDFGELASLKGVIQYPVRVRCATLAWHALREALNTP
jgi:nitrogen fixation protein NifU and related proteins